MQGIIHNNPGVITGRISGGGVLTGRLSPGTGGGGQPSELPDINIFNYGNFNWINGIAHYETHQNNTSTVYSTSPLYTIQSGNMNFSGSGRGNMRSALVIPYIDKTKRKLKIRASVSNIATYNSFGACVASAIDPNVFRIWTTAVGTRTGLSDPTEIVWMTRFNIEGKNIEVDNGTIVLPFSGITGDTLVLFLHQCDNTVNIHSIWFE